ncbi:hypothetical protein SAMN05216215_102443 [Saccharopolyspora shandongensis]|uniref:Uncharacterized protein n=1 Tax=Saccharopolyspora shandongensis TaxID=418495 RepID=A0A1H3IYM1_9PSEU|nr:hypothetical protein SAMN05216215_102443 [Saccharopolyspora shandongensis]
MRSPRRLLLRQAIETALLLTQTLGDQHEISSSTRCSPTFKFNRILAAGVPSLQFALRIAGLASNRFQLRKPTPKAKHRRNHTATLWRTEGVGKPHIFLIKSTDGTTRANTTNAGPVTRLKAV